ncbi:ATP-dependent RNA helicase putative [Euphorbia peplus]|nr:ATP-dependent RNA helicase putative [Euphorbia peplus]
MSASLDARVFSDYFGGAKAVHVEGRQHQVDILYTLYGEPDYLDAALITIFQIHLEESPGDILVFLTGQEEIESVDRLVIERLQQLPETSRKLLIVPYFHLFHQSSKCKFSCQLHLGITSGRTGREGPGKCF